MAALRKSWEFNARHSQLAPEGAWKIWLMLTGRGWGKNRTCSEWLHGKAYLYPDQVGFVAGRTLKHVRKYAIHLPRSGIMATMDALNPCVYKHHLSLIEWKNGAKCDVLTSEEPDDQRGGEYAYGLADELGTWKAVRDFKGNTTWMNLRFATRAKLKDGAVPQIVAATTPRATELLAQLVAEANQGSPRIALTSGTMYENRENLGAGFIEEIEAEYKGTWLWEQEALGKLLLEVEGAILTAQMLEDSRVEKDDCPAFSRIVVGVDPAAKSKKKSDLSGINVSGLGVDGELYSLADRTLKASPEGVARAACDAYWEFDALGAGPSLIVLEDNQGGAWLESVVRSYDSKPRIQNRTATASKGKRFAEICPHWERGEAHMVGSDQKKLERELCGFTMDGQWQGDGSPDRADAHVWAARELMLGQRASWSDMIEANA